MNANPNPTELETQLRQWTPRAPTARLERRLFARPTSEEADAGPGGFAWQVWLGPAIAAVVLLAVAPASLRPGSPVFPREGIFLAASNPAVSMGALKSAVVAVNLWHAATLSSTNR